MRGPSWDCSWNSEQGFQTEPLPERSLFGSVRCGAVGIPMKLIGDDVRATARCSGWSDRACLASLACDELGIADRRANGAKFVYSATPPGQSGRRRARSRWPSLALLPASRPFQSKRRHARRGVPRSQCTRFPGPGWGPLVIDTPIRVRYHFERPLAGSSCRSVTRRRDVAVWMSSVASTGRSWEA